MRVAYEGAEKRALRSYAQGGKAAHAHVAAGSAAGSSAAPKWEYESK